jgi:hypothetical protein
MGGGGTTADRGENSDINALEIAVRLESLISHKFIDSTSPNYKTLSKKIIQSLKTKAE